MKLVYKIDQETFEYESDDQFSHGESQILSNSETDITYNQNWYKLGYNIENILNIEEFADLKNGIRSAIYNIIKNELGDIFNCDLEDYHKIINTNESHYKIVSKTRDLFGVDFQFDIKKYIKNFENILGFELSDINPYTNQEVHIIIRINRPNSKDFNPVHKDIYEDFDDNKYIPKFINFWIPICGVDVKSSLPLSPGSHLIDESKINRTQVGATIDGNKYRVRVIKDWGGSNHLIRPQVNYGQVLMFSPHLVHGLAVNKNSNTTRISLEFRLYKK